MHCDVTGFTAMSERLAGRGKEGAEVMVEVLNRFFHRMLGIAAGWSGEQIKFGGDAMLLLFTSDSHAELAAACALEMQGAMKEFRAVRAGGETHSLKMRIGIHSGSFYLASVGNPDNLLHLMIVGPDVNMAAEVEPAAAPGKVAVSAQTVAALNGACRLTGIRDGLFTLGPFGEIPPRPVTASSSAWSADLERYVHPLLRRRAGDVEAGEHRRATVMFINLLGLSEMVARGDDQAALEHADGYMRIVLGALASHGGFLLGSDVSETGDKVIILFGAPVSQAEPEAAALSCALALHKGLRASGLKLRHRIGVNSGFVFAGEVGSDERREYTVIGDAVNLSARLMTKARWGEIVVSDAAVKAAGDGYAAQRMRPMRVKGKTEPVRAWRLLTQAHKVTTGVQNELVGRDSELRRLRRRADRVRGGRPGWAYVSGEAGIGKSRLVEELESGLRSNGWQILRGRCHAHTAHVPYAAWGDVLRSLFKVGPQDGIERLREEMSRLAPGHAAAAGILASALSLGQDITADDARDPEAARGLVKDAVVAAFSTVAATEPLLLIMEDVHWMDAVSADLLKVVMLRVDAPVLLVASSRDAQPPQDWAEIKGGTIVNLRPLDSQAARRLALSSATVDAAQLDAVVERAAGNPLLLSAFARSARESGGKVPETVEDAISSRVDVLPPGLKSAISAAAVVGPVFDRRTIAELLQAKTGDVDDVMALLVEAGLTRPEPAAPHTFGFTHIVIRQVVYEMLPYARRRRMHSQVVHHFESENVHRLDAVCEDLLYHSELADDKRRTIRYAFLSGDRATRMYAADEAADYYSRALAVLDEHAPSATTDRSIVLERLGDTLELVGRHSDAGKRYEESIEILRAGGARPRFVSRLRGDTARAAGLCLKTAMSFERAARYEDSLEWLERALALLPHRKTRLGSQIYASRAVALYRLGRIDEAVEWGRRGLDLATRSRDPRRIANSHNMLANSYMERGDLRTAVRHLRRAVRIYHEIGDFQGQASANNNLGMCYHLQGTLDAALYYYQVALQTDQRLGDAVDAMIARSNIGEVLMTQGRLEESIEYLEEVVKAHSQLGGLTGLAGLASINLSRCYLASNDYASAARHLRRAKRLLREAGVSGMLVEADLQGAELMLAEGRSRSAAARARSALRGARRLGAQLLEARGERILAEALGEQGRPRAAIPHLQVSVKLARRIAATHEEARALLSAARNEIRLGRVGARTVATLRRAEKIFRRMGARLELEEAQELLQRIAG
jgi:class 3 adenylate cyclase/tetratricopeptide (TPR) repeat protein